MSDSIHHVPGRIRVRLAALRRNPGQAADARRLLADQTGVAEVQVNTLTGSLLVFYDSKATTARHILDALATGGFKLPHTASRPLNHLAEAAVSMAVDRLVERGAALLLASLI